MNDQVVRIDGSAELRARWVREVYEHGVRDGLQLASTAIAERVAAALERPTGHGGTDLDVETRHTVMDLYARYLGVMSFADGVPPAWPAPVCSHGRADVGTCAEGGHDA